MPIPRPLDRRALASRALALLPVGTGRAAGLGAGGGEAGLIAPNVCLLTPETTAGPYYLDPELVRADITEGRPGAPLRLVLQVVDEDCRPVEGARVDVWHCDAAGNYSGFARQGSDRARDTRGETFMRGTQFADARGVAGFATIWPGWYRGRTPHVHYKVFLDERDAADQPALLPRRRQRGGLPRGAVPRRAPRAQDTTNASDGIARARRPARLRPGGAGGRALAGGAGRRGASSRVIAPGDAEEQCPPLRIARVRPGSCPS